MVSEKVCTFAPAKKKRASAGVLFLCFAPVAQLVEHLTLNQGVQSSSLCGCTISKKAADMAQLVEQRIRNA